MLALAMTAAAVVGAVAGVLAIASIGALRNIVPQSPVLVALAQLFSYILLALLAAAGGATLYRFAPSRRHPKWKWLTPGSILFAVAWVVLTLGFGLYVSRFGNYGATYGSLSAMIVLLTWIFLSSYALLFGGELNSGLEHQTERDTAEGPERPLGARGAWAADHVASGEDEGRAARGDISRS